MGREQITASPNTDKILTDTADMQPKLGTPAGADMSTDIASLQTDVDTIDGRIGSEYADGDGLPEVDNVRAHIYKIGGFGGARAQKDITFSNTGAGNVDLFTVTGDVIVRIVAVCTTDLTSAAGANVEVGTAADTDAMLPTTLATDIDTREVWHDSSPDSEVEALSTIREYIVTDGNDIIIKLDAQVDTGAISFYCFWTPLDSTGSVVAA